MFVTLWLKNQVPDLASQARRAAARLLTATARLMVACRGWIMIVVADEEYRRLVVCQKWIIEIGRAGGGEEDG